MITMPRVYDLVVLSHDSNATLYRVRELGESKSVGVIDASIEDSRPNQRIQWLDVSTLMTPTNAQLARMR